jgi:hypothetical protein
MRTKKEKIFEEAMSLFLTTGKRKTVIQFINANGIIGNDAEKMATEAYISTKGKLYHLLEFQEYKSHGGPFGKLLMGFLMLELGIFVLIESNQLFNFIFILGACFIIAGMIECYNQPFRKR